MMYLLGPGTFLPATSSFGPDYVPLWSRSGLSLHAKAVPRGLTETVQKGSIYDEWATPERSAGRRCGRPRPELDRRAEGPQANSSRLCSQPPCPTWANDLIRQATGSVCLSEGQVEAREGRGN